MTGEEEWFNVKHSSTRMCVEPSFDILEAQFKEDGGESSFNLDFIPMVVHSCCILHNILLVSKYRTLDQILRDCHLPAMEDDCNCHGAEEHVFESSQPVSMDTKGRALLEGKMTREDLLDYVVRTQNGSRSRASNYTRAQHFGNAQGR